jgi:hypothetical protein
MSDLPRWLLPLLALLAAPAATAGEPDPRTRAALALAVAAYRPPAPIQNDDHASTTEYERLRARAVVENRPLLVWVGLSRPDLERDRPDGLHYHCATFPGAVPPCVVVGRPAGGELWRAGDVPAAAADALRPVPPVPRPARPACGPHGCH